MRVHRRCDSTVWPEEAKLSAEDWLDESELLDSPARSASRNWQAVTTAARQDWQIG